MKPRITRNTAMWQVVISLALLMISSSVLAVSAASSGGNYYNANDKEFYLTSDEIYFIRPGLDVALISFEIPADLQPLVTFSLKDPGGLPLDINGVYTPGKVEMRYTLTYIPQGEEQKVRLTIGTTDSGGTTTALGDGVYTYKFGTILPDTYDPDATTTAGLAGRRDLREYGLDRYADNVLYNYVPSGASEPQPRNIVTIETCNGRCHDPLAMHGDRYIDTDMCTQCHNPQLFDETEGLSYSFNVLIHRLHSDVEDYPAPLNDCTSCHTGGTPTENFPLVANPNPVPVCDSSGYGTTALTWGGIDASEIRVGAANGPVVGNVTGSGSQETGKWVSNGTPFFLIDSATGATLQQLSVNTTVLGCVANAPGTFRGEPGIQHTNWMDHPSAVVCTSCHENVNLETGENHPAGAQPDSKCGQCHRPTGKEYGASVSGAHTVLYKSAQLPGLRVDILGVTNTAPGAKPTVKFSVGSKDVALDPAALNRLRFSISGPNTDFSFYVQETVGSSAVKVGDDWTYTFKAALPKTAKGSYTVGVEGRNTVMIDMGGDAPVSVSDQAQNSVLAFAVTDAVAMPRRTVVADYNCEDCHTNLSLHGDNRNNTDYCVTCHQPGATDAGVRPPAAMPAESIHFKFMVHKIHMGAELENGYTVYGYGGSVNDLDFVEYPGNLANCGKCHVDDSYQLPPPAGVLATTTNYNLWTPTQPMAAACLSCHDGDSEATHAFANTTVFGESCSVCHGVGKGFAVDKVHAQ